MSDYLADLAARVAEGEVTPPDDEDVETHCPCLWQLLTQSRWADGSTRILPRIVLERVAGGYRAVLQDDALCVKIAVLCPRIADVATCLEGAMTNGHAVWEGFKSFRNRAGPKVPEKLAKSPRRKK